jgi:hypothetical protein
MAVFTDHFVNFLAVKVIDYLIVDHHAGAS